YGTTFTIYVLGKLETITGKETIREVVKNDDLSFYDSPDMNPTSTSLKIVKKLVITNVKHLISRLQRSITNHIDTYIGECVEPKVISDPYEFLYTMISELAANIIVGEECCQYEDILETFRNLTYSVIRIFFAPKLLFFIHPWFHKQLIIFPLRFISNHKDVIINRIKPIIKKRLAIKKKLGDDWVAPVDALQFLLNEPFIAPDVDPNNARLIRTSHLLQ
ncbi:5577_t:CDS:2, partial [Racocetra persica]